MKVEAAKEIATLINGNDEDADTFATHFSGHMDGYEFARKLDRHAGYCFCMADIEMLDGMYWAVEEIRRRHEKKWFIANDIKPPLDIGVEIKQGRITGIDEYSTACYRIKENGCTDDSRFLIIRFEDAKAV